MNAIETHALTRRFGAHTAVDGLDLTVRQGELFALLGVNGAGKTTTLRMLSGLLQPTGGEGILRCRLLDMGLIPNTRVTVQKIAPMGDPMEIRLRSYELTLRMDDAAQIEILPEVGA